MHTLTVRKCDCETLDSKHRKLHTTKSSDLTQGRVRLFQAAKNGSRIRIDFDLKATRDPRISSGEEKKGVTWRMTLASRQGVGAALGFGG